MKNYHPIRELWLNRMRTFYREPEAIFWTYGFPIIMTVGLGIAFRNRPPEVIDVDIEDGPRAVEVQQHLEEHEAFDVEVHDADMCYERLRLGKSAVVVVPGDTFQYRYDPNRPESYLARTKLDDALQRAYGRADAVEVEENLVTEPGARYIDFLVPGLIGMNILGGGLWGMGFVLTDMRVKKLLKRLVATPMRKTHFLLAQIAGRLCFTVPEIVIMLLAGWLIFDIHIAGSIVSIFVLGFIGALSFAGLGLFVACRAQKIETISGLMNLVMLPMWLFCGIFFSSERFPDAFQPFIQFLPLTHLIDALRAVILEGASLASQTMHIVVLVIWGLISFVLALKWFRWT